MAKLPQDLAGGGKVKSGRPMMNLRGKADEKMAEAARYDEMPAIYPGHERALTRMRDRTEHQAMRLDDQNTHMLRRGGIVFAHKPVDAE